MPPNKMNMRDVIARKQAGLELTTAEIEDLVRGYVQGSVTDYQMSALLMAIYFRGMSFRETADLVKVMTASGKQTDLSNIPGRKVDKHSTGGVGDKVSLLVAPIVSSLGVPVPMISGRGLGHTGGTLDKLESIPGFTTALSVRQFAEQLSRIGCALIGQSDEIVPADKKMYALRDVTSTVKSNPLIAGSILSKKIAEGIDALVLDVKFGRGAIFEEVSQARELARLLVAIGTKLGLEVRALLTDMDQPLGRAVGNWLEIRECLDLMRGETDSPDLLELSMTQSAIMLTLGGKAADYESGRSMAAEALKSGRAFQKFVEIARSQKADVNFLENPSRYPKAAASRDVKSNKSGYVQSLDALAIGEAAMNLGAGRKRLEDRIDFGAGIILHKKRGDRVVRNDLLATLYSASEEKIETALPTVFDAYRIEENEPEARPLIISEIMPEGERLWN